MIDPDHNNVDVSANHYIDVQNNSIGDIRFELHLHLDAKQANWLIRILKRIFSK